MKLLRYLGGILAATVAVTAYAAVPNDYPKKPVSVIVTFPPGNSADLVGRTLAEELGRKFQQAFVVDNKGGAGGIIGIDYVARMPADGYTITVTSLSPITVIPVTQKVSYDPLRQLKPISLLAQGPMVVVVRKDSPFHTIQDLIAIARANPGKLNYGSLGNGTISQLTTEMFKAGAGVKLTEIPYKGSTQAMTDLIGGQIDVLFDGNASAMAQMKGGTVRALAVTSPKRSPLMPAIPSLTEIGIAGLKNFQSLGWMGAFAPAGTSQAVVDKLHAALQEALKSPAVIERFNGAGLEAVGSASPAAFADFVRADYERWRGVARLVDAGGVKQ
ncbi:hypothetical protein D9M68_129320 [compost metagenome]